MHYYLLQSLLRWPECLPHASLLFPGSAQDTTLHSVIVPPCSVLAVTVSVTFLVFDEVDRFEDCWSGILWYTDKPPPLRVGGYVFLMIRLELKV